MKRPVRIPHPHIPNDEWMTQVRTNAAGATAEVDVQTAYVQRMIALAMRFVVLEADEWQRTNVNLAARAVDRRDREHRVERLRRLHIEAEAVNVALARHVTRK